MGWGCAAWGLSVVRGECAWPGTSVHGVRGCEVNAWCEVNVRGVGERSQGHRGAPTAWVSACRAWEEGAAGVG